MPERTKREWAVVIALAVAGIVVARLAPGFYDKVVLTAVLLGFIGIIVWPIWSGRRARSRSERRDRFREWGPGDG